MSPLKIKYSSLKILRAQIVKEKKIKKMMEARGKELHMFKPDDNIEELFCP